MPEKWLLKQGEVGKVMTVTLKDANGAVLLTGKTVVFSARQSINSETAVIDDAVCTVDPDQVNNKGKISYAFTSTTAAIDLNENGYYVEFKVTGGGVTQYFPLKFSKDESYGRLIVRANID